MKFSTYSPSVHPNTLQNVPMHVSRDLNVYGGRGGGEMWGALANAAKIGLAMQQKVIDGKTLEANAEYNRLMSEGTSALMQKKEGEALTITDEYDKLQKSVLAQVNKKYGGYLYGDARESFNAYTMRDDATRRSHMMQYQMAETDKYHETQFNNQLATCQEFVLGGGGTDAAINEAYNRGIGLLHSRYENYGDEKIKEQERIFKGQLVASALSMAVNMGNYARMNDICDKYGKYIDPKTFATVKSLTMKRDREEQELSFHQKMLQEIGANASNEAVRQYMADNWKYLHPSKGNYKGSHAEAWKEAQWVESKTGLPAEFIYRQWAHESAYFSSQLARENNNFGGLTQVEPNGEDNRQPDGNNYYKEYANMHEYAEDYIKSFINYYDGTENVKTLADFAHYLKENDYYGADEADYLAAMERVEMEPDGDEPEETAPSGVEFENAVQEALKYRDNQRNLITTENNRLIKAASLDVQEMVNNGDLSEIDNLPMKYGINSDGTTNRDVMVSVQALVNAEKARQEKAAERAAKGQPSGKMDATLEDYLIQRISTGAIKSTDAIIDICNEIGITDPKEQAKCTKIFEDYLDNKGAFALSKDDYRTIEAYIPEFEGVKGPAKVKMAETIHTLARMEAKKYMAEHDGEMPDNIQLAEMVSKAFTEKVDTGGRTMRDSMFGAWFSTPITISKADLAANGYANAKYLGDGRYMLLKLDGYSADYKDEDEFLKMIGRSGYDEP